MKVVILAAGYATRLYPLTIDSPKCLLSVGGKTILDWICEKLTVLNDIEEITIVTNAKFFEKLNVWKKESAHSVPIRLVNDGTSSNETRLGAVRDIRLGIGADAAKTDWLVLASDNLFDRGLNDFVDFAKSKNEATTIAVHDIADPQRAAGKFGVIEVNSQWEVQRIEEKPKSPKSSLIGMGVYYFPKAALGFIDEYLRQPGAKDAPGYYLQWLVGRAKIFGFLFSGMWYDIGDLDALKEADSSFRSTN